MKIGIKLFYTIMLVLLIAMCAGIALVATQVIPVQTAHELIEGMVTLSWANILWIAGAAIIIILSIIVIALGFSKGSRPAAKTVDVITNAKGTASVTINALVELTQRCLGEIYGIVPQNIQIYPTDGGSGVDVRLIIAMKPEIEMPATSETIMKNVSEYLKKYGGITTGEVIVTIVPLKNPAKS